MECVLRILFCCVKREEEMEERRNNGLKKGGENIRLDLELGKRFISDKNKILKKEQLYHDIVQGYLFRTNCNCSQKS